MDTYTRKDEIALWQMYIYSGTSAIAEAPDADGITILRTAGGNEYRFPISMEKPFVPQLTATLRQALIALHPENKNACLMLIGEESFILRSIEDTMLSKVM